jgi:chitodextrinase
VGVTGYRVYRNGNQIGTTGIASYTDNTVSPQTSYQYTVAAYDAVSNLSAQSDSVSVTTPQFLDFIAPTAPSNLTATSAAGPVVNLNWTASSDNVGVTGYEIWRNGSLLTTVTGTSYSDAAVAAGETYTYAIKAYDAASNTSTSSNTISVTLPTPDTQAPTAPTGLTVTATSQTTVSLGWTASSDNVGVTGYRIFRNGTQVGTSISTTYTDTGLAASTAYDYTVKAIDAAQNASSDSNTASTTTQAVPTGITIDKSVVVKQTTASTSLTAPSFSTAAPNELLVAFISSDGPNSTFTMSGVTGGGLTWTLRKRTNTQRGTSEIWTANATSMTSNIVVKATHTGSYQGMMHVVAFQNAAVGANGGANGASGAPSASLTTTAANAWVWGVGNDWDNATARTVGSGQTKAQEMLAPIGDTFWVQNRTSTTPVVGTSVTINDAAPTSDRWNLALIEIIPQ